MPANYHTTADAALALGVSVRRVQAIARRRGLGEKRGRDWLFSPADLAALAAKGRAGRPRRVAGEIAEPLETGKADGNE